jgi:uncharacterized protein YoxC
LHSGRCVAVREVGPDELVPGAAFVIVTLAAAELPGWVDWLNAAASVLIAIALVVAAIALAGVAVAARKMVGRVNGLVGRMQEQATPVLRHGQDVAENVNYITTSIREDVQRLKGTIHTAQAKLERAAETTERRISDFNALLEVVQEEAEAIFVSTASTVRGVRAGADRIRVPRTRRWTEDELDGRQRDEP